MVRKTSFVPRRDGNVSWPIEGFKNRSKGLEKLIRYRDSHIAGRFGRRISASARCFKRWILHQSKARRSKSWIVLEMSGADFAVIMRWSQSHWQL
jgi:hypothetical protein